MTHFADLGTETQIASAPYVRAVGWLAASVPYATGDAPADIVSKLRALADRWGASASALGWPAAAGSHTCEFCGTVRAAGNFGVPAGSVLYVAPEMVAHYVAAHRYAPPSGFVEAVLRCPLPDSSEYAESVRSFAVAQAD